jgi:NADH-quinone oxidoreductase subunit G
MPTLKIDGRDVTVEPGTTVLQAAQKLGIEIPTFCYHPGLSIPANCRMCLVELQGAPGKPPPKPIPACFTAAADGMQVLASSEGTKRLRESVLEFILVNHPVDCPICDQAGECVLQDHYFRFSAQPSRLKTGKVHKPKVKPLGPDIMLDAERCIVCTRCVRFCDEVAKVSQLEVVSRGETSEITTFPGRELDNPYAGNVVDICPVGALTSRDFRFRTRVWFLQSGESVCPECARGCRIRVDHFENVVRRVKPLPNPQVNQYWMCDEGRGAFRNYLEDRMEGPLVEADGKRRVVPLEQAIEAAAERLAAAAKGRVAVLATPWFTNEDALVVGRLVAEALPGAALFLGGRAPGFGDRILIQPDKNPNRRGVELVFGALGITTKPLGELDPSAWDVVLSFGDQHPLTGSQLEALARQESLVAVGAFRTPLWERAKVFLPARTHVEKEGSFTNVDGVVQLLDPVIRAASTCKSEGYLAMKLGEKLGANLRYADPAAIFRDLVARVPAYRELAGRPLGPFGVKLGGEPAAPEAEASP